MKLASFRPRLMVGVVVAFCCSIAVALAATAPTTPKDKKHQHKAQAEETCASCHLQMNHPQLPSLFTQDCASCHSAANDKNPTGEFMEMAVEPVADPTKANLTEGMSVPLYYDQTRIGAEPNEMALVPAGSFTMGTNNRLPDEGPEHIVDLKAFWIDKYEVTNLQYKQFIDATRRKSPDHFENRTFPDGKADHPVTFVTWNDATAYCTWAGKRLPTDQEWEKAARGADGRVFPWGLEFDMNKANTPMRWKHQNHEGDTTPVGAFAAGTSPYGVLDMSGNVWEWTASWYLPYPGNDHPTENYGELYKTLKGGSWWDCSFYKCGISAPLYNRSFFLPRTKNKSFGFRCAKDADNNKQETKAP